MRADPRAPAAALPAEALTRCGCDRGASWHAREAVLSSVFELHASPAVADFAEHLRPGRSPAASGQARERTRPTATANRPGSCACSWTTATAEDCPPTD
ncbi:hypothetical protein [Kitasatospora purpeofusca]|uniref:hypothetical protein n=1 Tax=Kitasatospora purpeofusca TaxID=67352 RepID=UPI003F4AE733